MHSEEIIDDLLDKVAKLKTERDAMKATLDDYIADYRAVLDEQCAKDEKHCTCVPHLRQRIKAAEAERDAYKADAERYRWLRDRAWPFEFKGNSPEDADAAIDVARGET